MALTILIVVVVVALAAAFYMLTRRDGAASLAEGVNTADEADGVVSEPVPVNGTGQLSDSDRITWTKQFDPSGRPLSDEARLRLIEDLALLRASWCIPLLDQACREETNSVHRTAAQRALALCRDHDLARGNAK
jgi:hypothetical protein